MGAQQTIKYSVSQYYQNMLLYIVRISSGLFVLLSVLPGTTRGNGGTVFLNTRTHGLSADNCSLYLLWPCAIIFPTQNTGHQEFPWFRASNISHINLPDKLGDWTTERLHSTRSITFKSGSLSCHNCVQIKCVKCVLARFDTYDTCWGRSMETSHIVPESDRNRLNVTSHVRRLWRIMAYLRFCRIELL